MDLEARYDAMHAVWWNAASVAELEEELGGEEEMSAFIWSSVAKGRFMGRGREVAFRYSQKATTAQLWEMLLKAGESLDPSWVRAAVERDPELAGTQPDAGTTLKLMVDCILVGLGKGSCDTQELAANFCADQKRWRSSVADCVIDPETRKNFWTAFPEAFLAGSLFSFEALESTLRTLKDPELTLQVVDGLLGAQEGQMFSRRVLDQAVLALAEVTGPEKVLELFKVEGRRYDQHPMLSALLFLRGGQSVPEELDETLKWADAVHAHRLELLTALPTDRALALLPTPCTLSSMLDISLGSVVQDKAPMERAIAAAHGVKQLHEINGYSGGLSAYGLALVAPLAEELQKKLPVKAACAFVDALHLTGEVDAAPCLVEAALNSKPLVRARACRALENLDERAVPALEAIIAGKSKAKAKKAQLILDQLPHRLLALDTPLGALLGRAQDMDLDAAPRLDTGALDSATLIEKHQNLAVAILRPTFLRAALPATSEVTHGWPAADWQRLVLALGEDEEAVWMLIDTFARFHPLTHSKVNHEWVDVWSPMVGDKKLQIRNVLPPGLKAEYARPALDWVLANVQSVYQKELKGWRATLGA